LVFPELHARDKVAVVRELAGLLGAARDLDPALLAEALLERERLASTGIGEGVAIPHAKLEAVGQLIGCVGRARDGIDFGAIDGRPTYLFVVFMTPETATGRHLKALARISRVLKSAELRARVMQANDGLEIYRALVQEDAKP
jgi:PTS system nitrogen regulatory IIA component